MGILDGQPVNQSITNPAFINKNIDDVMPNKLGFSRSGSGSSIADIQQAVNNLYTATGVSETQTGTVYNATPNTINNGDPYQTALTKLANKFDAVTGHKHTGASGDAPAIAASTLTGNLLISSFNSGTNASTGTFWRGDGSWQPVVQSVAASGSTALTGAVVLAASGSTTLTESGQTITIFSPASGSAVNSIAASGSAALTGAVVLAASGSVTLTESGQTITIFAPASGTAVNSLAASGNAALTGAVLLVAGTNVTLGQSGQNITINATAASGASVFTDSAFEVDNVSDSSKKFKFSLGGAATGTTTRILSVGTGSFDYTLPDGQSTTLVGIDPTQTLLNKTLTYLKTNVANDGATGSGVTLSSVSTGTVRMTGSGLTSVSGIPSGTINETLVIENQTGGTIIVKNQDATATSSNRIITGTGGDISLLNNASISLVYDNTLSRWVVVGTGINSYSLNNYLLNSNFDFWQRGTSTLVTNGNSTYVADRWYVKNSLGTSGVITGSQVTASSTNSKYGCQVKITTAPTAGQTNGTELFQTMENQQSIDLFGQSISASAKIKALGNVNQVGIQFFSATGESKVTTTLGTEQLITVNTSTLTTGILQNQSVSSPGSGGVIGIRIRITAASTGNTYDLNNGFIVEQAMLNIGAVPAPYQRAINPIASELSACQRFYEKSYAQTTALATATELGISKVNAYNATTGQKMLTAYFRSSKRTISGTMSLWDEAGNGGTTQKISTIDINGTVTNNQSPGLVQIGEGSFQVFAANGTETGLSFHFGYDAEI